jgi:hypothetical protein
MAQTRHLNRPHMRLMSARSAKRWGRWFVIAWIGMWMSTALLPCCEVEAAVAAHSQALHSDCGHPADEAPAPRGGHKTGVCLGIAAPAPAAAERPAAAASGSVVYQMVAISASFYVPSPASALAHPPVYGAPPPAAIYLRSSRLLI